MKYKFNRTEFDTDKMQPLSSAMGWNLPMRPGDIVEVDGYELTAPNEGYFDLMTKTFRAFVKVQSLSEKIHALNAFNLDQAFTITKRELLEKLK